MGLPTWQPIICLDQSPMTWLFFLLAGITLIGGLGVVVTRNVVHAALFLLLALMAVAGIYLLLFTEFLALVQVLIYGGAIIIVVLFAIMLTRTAEYPRITDNPQWPLAIVAALGVAATLGVSFWVGSTSSSGPQSPDFTDLATSLFTRWAIPFEVASLVLLVALIGAIIIARSGGGESS